MVQIHLYANNIAHVLVQEKEKKNSMSIVQLAISTYPLQF